MKKLERNLHRKLLIKEENPVINHQKEKVKKEKVKKEKQKID